MQLQVRMNADSATGGGANGRLQSSGNQPGGRSVGLIGKLSRIQHSGNSVFHLHSVLAAIFQIRNPKFLSISNIKDLLANTAILSILAAA